MAIPYPSGSPSPGYGCGAGDITFPRFLEQRRQYGRSNLPQVAKVLLAPAACGHCGKIEELWRDQNTYSASNGSGPQDHGMTVPDPDSLAKQIAFEGNSCFTCVKTIFEATQWIDGGDHRRDTPLHYAASSGNLRMLCHLICQLGDFYGHEWTVLVVRKLNVHGETALHEAIRLGSRCMAGMLMWVDPHLAQHPRAGTSPLYLAVSLGHKHIAEMLHRTSGGNLSYSGPHGQNALHAAALHRPYGMIEMLLDWNKDLSKEKDLNGSTPLHSAVSAQYSEDCIRRCYTLLCRLCYLVFPNMFPNMIRFPLEKHAAWRILDANPSAAYQQENNGLFPVHIAALMDREVAILILLKRCGGCIALCDKQGKSFFHIAVQNKARQIVIYACQEAVFAPMLNARDNDGNTALHLAVEVEDLVIFCHLLWNPKVLLNVRNNKDRTPLDLARSKLRAKFSYTQNPENVIYRTLRNAGARHGSFRRYRVQKLRSEELDEANGKNREDEEKKEVNPVKELVKVLKKKEKKDSDQMNDSTRTLGLLSVLITTMTFGAAFTVPSAVKAGGNGGVPRLFGTWDFNAFVMANALAFVCSSVATVCLTFSGMPMVQLKSAGITSGFPGSSPTVRSPA